MYMSKCNEVKCKKLIVTIHLSLGKWKKIINQGGYSNE